MGSQDKGQYKKTGVKQILKNGRVSVLLCIICLFCFIAFFAFFPHKQEFKSGEGNMTVALGEYSISKPIKLFIPAINVEAKVEHVGFTKKMTMASPSNYSNVGWYRHGTIPGQKGSAVIDGHLDNGFGFPAVFGKLDQLKVGESIFLENENDETLEFVVQDIATYDYKNAPTDLIFGQDDDIYLKLITCDGSWVGRDKTYDTRLVVTSVLKR